MLERLYNKLWKNIEIRTVILIFLVELLGVLIEAIFIFFPTDDIKNWVGFLYFEIDLFGNKLTPLLTILHLIVWLLIFFSSVMLYCIIREYAGGRAGLLEIGGLTLIITVAVWMFYGNMLTIFFIIGAGAIFFYMFLALRPD